jgi:hypothetical protein
MNNDHEAFIADVARLIEAWGNLHGGLTKAVDFFKDPGEFRTIENKRELLAAMLVVVGQFVADTTDLRITDDQHIAGEYFELSSAIENLNRGIVGPLLRRSIPSTRKAPTSKKWRRPGDPSYIWRARARVALALIAYMRSGLRQDEAAEKIAREHRSLRRLVGKKTRGKLAATIIHWRKEFGAKRRKESGGRVQDYEATEAFKEGLRRIDEMCAVLDIEGLKAFARDQLKEAARVLSINC